MLRLHWHRCSIDKNINLLFEQRNTNITTCNSNQLQEKSFSNFIKLKRKTILNLSICKNILDNMLVLTPAL